MEDQKPVDKSEDIKLSLIEVEKALDLLLPLFTFEPEDKPAEKPEE